MRDFTVLTSVVQFKKLGGAELGDCAHVLSPNLSSKHPIGMLNVPLEKLETF